MLFILSVGCVSGTLFLYIEREVILVGLKIVSEYDQEIRQSQTADNPVAPRGRAAQSLLTNCQPSGELSLGQN